MIIRYGELTRRWNWTSCGENLTLSDRSFQVIGVVPTQSRSAIAQDLVVDKAQRVAKSGDVKAVADYTAAVIETEAIRVYAGGDNEEIGQKRILSQTAPIRETLGAGVLSSALKLVPEFIQENVKARPQLMEHTNSLFGRFSKEVQ